jgi:ubiquinone/menaquinone biosynthesis C-methylase UbiE
VTGTAGLFDGELYAANTGHHRAHDDDVLAGLPLAPGTDVLDLGCGSGDFTARLVPMVAPGRVVGVDVSPSQVAHARAHHPGAEFVAGRAQDVGSLFPASSFDVVFTVATLHWVPAEEQPAVLAGVARVLRPGGVLRADLGGAGQIAAARAVLDGVSSRHGGPASPWCFPEPEPYAGLLAEAGLTVRRARLVHQRRAFPDPAAFEGWLRSQVLPAYLPGVPDGARDAFTAECVREGLARLRRDDGSYDQDYVRLDVLATR